LKVVVPVTHNLSEPIVQPPRDRDVPAATPRVGVVRVRFVAASPLGSVVDSLGTPEPFVTSTALFTAAIWLRTGPEPTYKILLVVPLVTVPPMAILPPAGHVWNDGIVVA
jgi:hypothetical protein